MAGTMIRMVTNCTGIRIAHCRIRVVRMVKYGAALLESVFVRKIQKVFSSRLKISWLMATAAPARIGVCFL